jgi:hypothetical protein
MKTCNEKRKFLNNRENLSYRNKLKKKQIVVDEKESSYFSKKIIIDK